MHPSTKSESVIYIYVRQRRIMSFQINKPMLSKMQQKAAPYRIRRAFEADEMLLKEVVPLQDQDQMMAKVSAFRSKLPGTGVHHDDNKCTVGNNIETYNKVSGAGGLPLCQTCRGL
jgi:hypothetical protein